jgi:hypothetical protein
MTTNSPVFRSHYLDICFVKLLSIAPGFSPLGWSYEGFIYPQIFFPGFFLVRVRSPEEKSMNIYQYKQINMVRKWKTILKVVSIKHLN